MAERKLTSTNYRNQSFLEEKCTLNELLDLISKRWICEVLFAIEEGHSRFKNIREELKYISDAILSDRLKLLEKHDLIIRNSYDEIPPRVEYTLSKKGSKLSDFLDQLCKFSETVFVDKEAEVEAN